MKKILLMLLVITVTLFGDIKQDLAKDWEILSVKEKESILKSFETGEKYNIGLTLAAINWQESNGGRYQISTDNKDFGLYHINLYWYFKEFKIPDNMWNRSKHATLLLTKPEVSEQYVISKINNLLSIHDGDKFKVWKSYNGSHNYAVDISEKVKFLKNVLHKQTVYTVYGRAIHALA